MTSTSSIVAVVPAAGIGSRMQADIPKQYLCVAGKTIIEHTLTALSSHPAIERVVVALSPSDTYFSQLSVSDAPWLTVTEGGSERADSVQNALSLLNNDDWALVHDAARPCLGHADIDSLLAVVDRTDVAGGILATPVRDTMKRANDSRNQPCIKRTENRENLWHALTPQLFRVGMLQAALAGALKSGAIITDEASAMEWAGHRVALIDGNPANIKITRPADLPLAAFYLQQQDM